MMRRTLLALLVMATTVAAQTSPPLLVQVGVEHEGPVWVGQRVTVTVTALTPVRFADPLAWPDIAASEGRVMVLPEAATVPGTARVDGQSYAALARSYSVFPATPGQVVLAPISIHAQVAGADGQPVDAAATTHPVRLATRVPPGVTDLKRLIVAPSFSLKAGTEGEAAEVHVGNAITRTVRMEAEGTASMMLPPAIWSAPEGVRVYADPPVLQDHADRGELRALRSERASFVPERPGRIELPGYAISWLDPRRGQVQQVTVPPLHVVVLPAAEAPAGARRVPWWWVVAASAGLLGLAGAVWWLLRRPRDVSREALGTLLRACRSGEPRAALRALYRWSDVVAPGGGERTLARLAGISGAPALLAEARRLEAVFYGSGGQWDGAALAAAARAAHRSLRRSGPRAHGSEVLPPLNPASAIVLPPRLTQPRWAR